MSNTKVILMHENNAYEYKAEDYVGVPKEFLIVDPNMTKNTWVSKMLEKLPLTQLPMGLRPQYARGIQPPKFFYGSLLNVEELHLAAARLGVAVYYSDTDDEFTDVTVTSQNDLRHRNEVPQRKRSCCDSDLYITKTLEKLGEKMTRDTKYHLTPRIEVVLHGTPQTTMPILCWLSSYDRTWVIDPSGFGRVLVTYLGSGAFYPKWYVDYEDYMWHASALH